LNLKQLVKPFVLRTAQLARLRQSEASLAKASDRYWSGVEDERFRGNSHWRGGISDEAWSSIGNRHLNLYRKFCAYAGRDPTTRRVVEWGCGGGANAIAFAREADAFVGVDVADSSLAECRRQLESEGLAERFQGVLASVDLPEEAAKEIDSGGACDLFLCVYVFELVPGPGYVRRLLVIAHDLLRPGGAALVQFKYRNDDWRSRSRRWAYRLNLANTTTLDIDEFWQMAAEAKLTAQALTLIPEDTLVGDQRYAYCLLTRD
jgi:SAM-dependent methyltransferase